MPNREKVVNAAYTGVAATATTLVAASPVVVAANWRVRNGGVPYADVTA